MINLLWIVVIIVTVLIFKLAENFYLLRLSKSDKENFLSPILNLLNLFKQKEKIDLTFIFSSLTVLLSIITIIAVAFRYNYLVFLFLFLLAECFILIGAVIKGEINGMISVQRGISRLFIISFIGFINAGTLYAVRNNLDIKDLTFNKDFLVVILIVLSFVVIVLMKDNRWIFDFELGSYKPSFLQNGYKASYTGLSLGMIEVSEMLILGAWLKLISYFLPFNSVISFLIIILIYAIAAVVDVKFSRHLWKKAAFNSFIIGGGLAILNLLWHF